MNSTITGSEKKAATLALLPSFFHQSWATSGKTAIDNSNKTNGTTKPTGIRAPNGSSMGSAPGWYVPDPVQTSTAPSAETRMNQREPVLSCGCHTLSFIEACVVFSRGWHWRLVRQCL